MQFVEDTVGSVTPYRRQHSPLHPRGSGKVPIVVDPPARLEAGKWTHEKSKGPFLFRLFARGCRPICGTAHRSRIAQRT